MILNYTCACVICIKHDKYALNNIALISKLVQHPGGSTEALNGCTTYQLINTRTKQRASWALILLFYF